jgi:hypothetical protein
MRGMKMAGIAVMGLAGLASAAGAQEAPQTSRQKAEHIVSQPARDVGVEKTKIPPVLAEASRAPYAMEGTATCGQIASGIGALNRALGPDFGGSTSSGKRSVAEVGGEAVVNSLIPFRGLVREVTGAAPAQRRLQAAINAGLARRGFLRGLQRGWKCR